MNHTRKALASSAAALGLLLDPLHPQRISKSQASASFPKPHLVSLDLWGTLFTPKAPVPQQYYAISHGEFGLSKLALSIAADFGRVFAEMERQFPNYGKYSEEIGSSDEWWLELIARVYELPRNDPETQKLCRRLIEHFGGSEAYVLFDDVTPFLEAMERNDVAVVGASNSDHRVYSILESLGVARFFPRDALYLSYDLGVAKPDRGFFRAVAQKYYPKAKRGGNMTMTQFLENSWHVGDHYEKDFAASVRSGWNGVLVDREKESVFFKNAPAPQGVTNDCFLGSSAASENPELVVISNNRVCVSGLGELLGLFEDMK